MEPFPRHADFEMAADVAFMYDALISKVRACVRACVLWLSEPPLVS